MSYNVFADMGFEHPEMELLKCEIVRSLRDLLSEKKSQMRQHPSYGVFPQRKLPLSSEVIGKTTRWNVCFSLRAPSAALFAFSLTATTFSLTARTLLPMRKPKRLR